MSVWDVHGTRLIHANPILELKLETIETPAGERTDWTVVEIGPGVAVLPIHADGSVTLVRQYRHALRRRMWELPAGRVEEGEALEVAARRELLEEAGLVAGSLEPRGEIVPLDGICRHVIHVFAARDLEERETAHETFEDIEVHRVDRPRLLAMIRSGELDCGITLSILARILLVEE